MKGLTKHQASAIEAAATEDAKVKAAAAVMVERPLDLIKHILMKHEQAVIEVMREQQQQIKSLVDALEMVRSDLDADYVIRPGGTTHVAVRAALEQHGESK